MTRASVPRLDINPGDRPSHLELDRRLAGELDGAVPETHKAATDAAAEALPPLDLVALQKTVAFIITLILRARVVVVVVVRTRFGIVV